MSTLANNPTLTPNAVADPNVSVNAPPSPPEKPPLPYVSFNGSNATKDLGDDGFNWEIPNFAAFANECDIYMCKKYPMLEEIKLGHKVPLHALTPKKLESSYGVADPADLRPLVFHILKRLFDVELFTKNNGANIEHIFWFEKEDVLSKDWGLSMNELEKEIENIEKFKLLYFFRVNNLKALSPYVRRCIKSAIGDEDPQERLKSNLLNSNGMVGVLAGLILAAILPLATNKDVGIFATRFSEIAIVTASICTCFTFLTIVYSADNVIRLSECPKDKMLLFVLSAFDRRAIFDRKFYSTNAFGYILNFASDYLYLLLVSVILVGTALWNWIGVYSQMYASSTYEEYVKEQNQNVTEMRHYYKLDQKPRSKQIDVNGQFLAIAICVMFLIGLLLARCAWLKVLSGVVAGIEPKPTDPAKLEKEKKNEEALEDVLKQLPNFGLEERSHKLRHRAMRRLVWVYIVLVIIWTGVSIWALWDCAYFIKDYWKKCCLVGTTSMTPTKHRL